MARTHPGAEALRAEDVATSSFRNAIPNSKRYTKKNKWSVEDVAQAAYEGNLDLLETLLSTGDESNLFNGDLNMHVPVECGFATSLYTALQLAAVSGQTECVELLLEAKADPHIKESVPHGMNPEEGATALDLAKKCGWDDCIELLEEGMKAHPYGWYQCFGKGNNSKCYDCWEPKPAPPAGWFMDRPGAAQLQGLDPSKYGGELAEPVDEGEEAITATLMGASAVQPLPIGLLFPDQGSHYVKMMYGVKDIPAVKEMCEKAQAILGFDVIQLCIEGPEERLQEICNCHPVMFIADLAGIEKLRRKREEAVTRAQAAAGPSVGQYVALTVAGVFTFEDGLKLLKFRSEALQEVASASAQAMISIAGLDKPTLTQLCEEAAKKEGSGTVCQIAGDLFPTGFSVGGTEKSILTLKVLAEKAGALQAKVMKPNCAFHTPLMKPAQEKLNKALDELLPKMSPPKITVVMNATASPVRPGTNPKVIVDLLKKELTSPILWESSVRAMIKEGIFEFYEVGPMKQLKSMMKRIDSRFWGSTHNVEL